MRAHRGHLLVILVGLFTALALAACPRATPTLTPTAAPTAAAAPTQDTWAEHAAGDVSVRLPGDWQVLELNQGDLQTLFADFQEENPELARIIGSAEALQGVALWAFRTVVPEAAFVDNLNIRRSALNGQKIEKMADVIAAVMGQYEQLGFEVKNSEADLTIGGLPAARLVYSFPVAGAGGKAATITGHQYLVASATDLWILSFSAAPDNEATLAPIFERIAQSFRVK